MKKSLGAKISVRATHVWVVGTYDSGGKPNMMTAAWGGVCCSQPPCVAVSLRKATYTYGSIVETQSLHGQCSVCRLCETNRLCWNLQWQKWR